MYTIFDWKREIKIVGKVGKLGGMISMCGDPAKIYLRSELWREVWKEWQLIKTHSSKVIPKKGAILQEKHWNVKIKSKL